ncbi:MAG: phosphatidate cytidylyltransferase [Robiginitomaculum sp.]|nr:phosphatidate cytidylyltransferase [Robiginitomaculum sp.]
MGEIAETTVKSSRWKTLGVRAVSGLVLMAICGIPIYFGGWIWAVFIVLVCARVIYEWVRMTDIGAGKLAFVVPVVGLLAVMGLAQYGLWQQALVSVVFIGAVATYERSRRSGGLWAGFGVLYVLLPSLTMLWLRGDVAGFAAAGFAKFLFIVVVVIAADTWAYLGGSTIGGPKLVPNISPNKTWSGLVSGFVFGAAFGALAAWVIGFNPAYGALLALPIVAFAVAGDLLESMIKRHLKVKDAGGIIPGHGGLLDRIDSLLLIVVVAAGALLLWPSLWPMV